MPTFYEFFAGGGMARAGLGPEWECLFANDFDQKKSRTYSSNWQNPEPFCADVREIELRDLPGKAHLVWASFPCQDLSLAGGGAGLRGDRSGTFWPFWSLMTKLRKVGRAPNVIALENVCGTLTSHGGKDFQAICEALDKGGYRYGAVVVDAALFVPQSRPRLFILAVDKSADLPQNVVGEGPQAPWHTRALCKAYDNLSAHRKKSWVWWSFPQPKRRANKLAQIVERSPNSVGWHTPEETQRLLDMMAPLHRERVRQASQSGKLKVGAIYRRTRKDEQGNKVQRAEVRFDGVAGCLRTPAGGSSRQVIMVVRGEDVRSRLISSREAARLMGLPDSFELPERYNEAYHLVGDGVAPPVVRHLAAHIIEPIVDFAAHGNKIVA